MEASADPRNLHPKVPAAGGRQALAVGLTPPILQLTNPLPSRTKRDFRAAFASELCWERNSASALVWVAASSPRQHGRAEVRAVEDQPGVSPHQPRVPAIRTWPDVQRQLLAEQVAEEVGLG